MITTDVAKTADRLTGLAFAEGYFKLTTRNCSAWEWFVLKSSGDTRAAARRWDACDMNHLIAVHTGRAEPKGADQQ